MLRLLLTLWVLAMLSSASLLLAVVALQAASRLLRRDSRRARHAPARASAGA